MLFLVLKITSSLTICRSNIFKKGSDTVVKCSELLLRIWNALGSNIGSDISKRN
jgi:hypothetical protein